MAQMAPPPAQMAPPPAQVASPIPASPAAEAATAVAPPERQTVWPPTRTNTPEQVDDETILESEEESEPGEMPETDSELPVSPRSATAELPESGTEPRVDTERAAEAAAAARDRGVETEGATIAAPADIGQKLDEIASLLRTLLLQNMSAGRAGGGGGGEAAPRSED